jgi:hypothetical protein
VPFHDDALFYRVHMLDVVRAIKYAIDRKLAGTFNLTHEEVPPSCKNYFGAIAKLQGLPPLSFRNELLAPTKPVSTKRLLQTGFRFEHTVAERMPAADAKPAALPAPAKLDTRGRDIVVKVLDQIVKALGLREELAEDKGPVLRLIARGGPMEGQDLGNFRVFRGGPIASLVYSAMTIEDFAMDTHQIYAFTKADDPRPSFTLDLAISTNTQGTFHIGLDLLPKVDLSSSLPMLSKVYEPLTPVLAEAMKMSGVEAAVSIGPLMRAMRSPWMLAAYVQPDALVRCQPAVDAYLARWLDVVQKPLDAEIAADVAWQDIKTRDQKHRAAMFHPETNRVWLLLERMLGRETVARMRGLLTA